MNGTRLLALAAALALFVSAQGVPARAQFSGPPPPVMSNSPMNSPMTNMMYDWGTRMDMEAMIPMSADIAMRPERIERAFRDARAHFTPAPSVDIAASLAKTSADPRVRAQYASYFHDRFSDFQTNIAKLGLPTDDAASACDYLYESIYYVTYGEVVTDGAKRQALRGNCTVTLALKQMNGKLRSDTDLTRYYQALGILAETLDREYNRANAARDEPTLARVRTLARSSFATLSGTPLDRYASLHDFLCAANPHAPCDTLLARERQLAK